MALNLSLDTIAVGTDNLWWWQPDTGESVIASQPGLSPAATASAAASACVVPAYEEDVGHLMGFTVAEMTRQSTSTASESKRRKKKWHAKLKLGKSECCRQACLSWLTVERQKKKRCWIRLMWHIISCQLSALLRISERKKSEFSHVKSPQLCPTWDKCDEHCRMSDNWVAIVNLSPGSNLWEIGYISTMAELKLEGKKEFSQMFCKDPLAWEFEINIRCYNYFSSGVHISYARGQWCTF